MSAVMDIKPKTAVSVMTNAYGSYTTSAILTDMEQCVSIDPEIKQNIRMEDVGKYSVFDVANWFLSKEQMTHKKLQKLCYYAQAWCYALKGYRLENTDFEAWVHGPVSPALWERFKSFGYDPICIKGKQSNLFEKDDLKLLEDVWDTYGDYTGNALESLSHRELPWIEARQGYDLDERCTVIISPKTMASYYKSIYSGE